MRNELTSEREDLIGDLQGHVAEIENVYRINRELKQKISRLEAMLYGRNISKKKWLSPIVDLSSYLCSTALKSFSDYFSSHRET